MTGFKRPKGDYWHLEFMSHLQAFAEEQQTQIDQLTAN